MLCWPLSLSCEHPPALASAQSASHPLRQNFVKTLPLLQSPLRCHRLLWGAPHSISLSGTAHGTSSFVASCSRSPRTEEKSLSTEKDATQCHPVRSLPSIACGRAGAESAAAAGPGLTAQEENRRRGPPYHACMGLGSLRTHIRQAHLRVATGLSASSLRSLQLVRESE